MFFDSAPTPLDLRFKLFDFHVRVSPWHWVGTGLLGLTWLEDGPGYWLAWILCVFVSILVHELGHAFAGRYFGTPSHIVLTACGGYAEFYHGTPPRGWRHLVVILMGPIAGFLFAAALYISNRSTGWMGQNIILLTIGYMLLSINIVWGLFNLLPIFPLDGGQALREILYIFGVRRGDAITHQVSIVTAGSLVVVGTLAMVNPRHELVQLMPFTPGPFMIVWLALYGVMNWQLLQRYSRANSWTDDDNDNPPWLRGR
ncbi:MAG: site-2 protease family protein [Fimbriiglobus sp.]